MSFVDLHEGVLEVFAERAAWNRVGDNTEHAAWARTLERRRESNRKSNERWRLKTPKAVKKAYHHASYMRNREKRLAWQNAYNARKRAARATPIRGSLSVGRTS